MIMMKKRNKIDLNTDVQIIIDLSGSMWGKRAILAACVAITLAESLSSVY